MFLSPQVNSYSYINLSGYSMIKLYCSRLLKFRCFFLADINLINNFLIPSSCKIKIIMKSLRCFQNSFAWKNAHNGNFRVYSLFSWEAVYSYEPIILSFLISGTPKDLNMFQIFNWWKFKDWKMAKCDKSLESSFSFLLVGFPVSIWVQILLLAHILSKI